MKTYIRYPLNVELISSMSILTILFILNIMNTNNKTNKFLCLTLIIIFILTITAAVIRRFLKPRLLQLDSRCLIIDNKPLEAREISRLFIDSNCIIGIKPKKSRIVPISLCFKLINTNNETSKLIDSLVDWAKNNNIEVINKNFMKWI